MDRTRVVCEAQLRILWGSLDADVNGRGSSVRWKSGVCPPEGGVWLVPLVRCWKPPLGSEPRSAAPWEVTGPPGQGLALSLVSGSSGADLDGSLKDVRFPSAKPAYLPGQRVQFPGDHQLCWAYSPPKKITRLHGALYS